MVFVLCARHRARIGLSGVRRVKVCFQQGRTKCVARARSKRSRLSRSVQTRGPRQPSSLLQLVVVHMGGDDEVLLL